MLHRPMNRVAVSAAQSNRGENDQSTYVRDMAIQSIWERAVIAALVRDKQFE